MPRFKPLDKILDNNVPKCSQRKTGFGYKNTNKKTLNTLINKDSVLNVPSVPAVPREKVVRREKCAGEAFSKRDVSRAKYQEPTYQECGMIQCSGCKYLAGGRCRHPTLHNGEWLFMDYERWRRCRGFKGYT